MTVIIPQLKELTSSDLSRDSLPADPRNCCVPIAAVIGPSNQNGGDIFYFEVATPSYLETAGQRWGRGLLLVSEFSWASAEHAVQRLLARAARPSWQEVAAELNKELRWEFESYQAHGA